MLGKDAYCSEKAFKGRFMALLGKDAHSNEHDNWGLFTAMPGLFL